ncbi:chymotrypsin-2-like [Onthophagus taurus]|uniref:chymotrypsin-2-like n=1 Tax=Onthophagus taurus TaxID=166361 RepID=UPI000C1FEC3E|nr:chymotrypsin-2-like [Onthophagus taurus]
MFLLYLICLLIKIGQIWSEENVSAIVVDLKTDSLPDPFEIDFSKSNEIDSDFKGKDLKVIGGLEASRNLFPFQSALYLTFKDGTTSFCGGSIISTNYILTAAHCVLNTFSLLVVVGTTDLNSNVNTQQRIYAKRYVYHHQYNTETLSNDIALLLLAKPIDFNEAVLPINLPTVEDTKYSYENLKVTVIGWGKTRDNGSIVPRLRYLNTQVLPNSNCKFYFPSVTSSNICTNGYLNVGSCHGDSGSPLIYGNKQIGIVSFGSNTCSAGFPSVYTRVSSYLGWINQYASFDY